MKTKKYSKNITSIIGLFFIVLLLIINFSNTIFASNVENSNNTILNKNDFCNYFFPFFENYLIQNNFLQIINNTNNNSNDLINSYININTDKLIYNADEKVLINHETNLKNNFIIEYWIEDLNENIIKSKLNTTNINQKTWTSKTNLKQEVFFIKSLLYDKTNNGIINNSKLIILKNENNNEIYENKITINKINSENKNFLNFGEIFFIDLEIEKGDSSKTLISAYIQNNNTKLSEITKIYVYGKNLKHRLIIPVAVKSNCNNKYNEGEYELIIEGIDVLVKNNIVIEGQKKDLCQEIKPDNINTNIVTTQKTNNAKIKTFYTLVKNYNEQINLFATFENVNKDMKIKLISENQKITIDINSNEKITIPVKAKKINNLYILELIDNDVIDIKYIEVNFSDNSFYDVKNTTPEKKDNKLNQNNNEPNILLNQNKDNFDNSNKSMDLITSGFIFKSVSMKSKDLIILFVIIILIVLLLIISKNKTFKQKIQKTVEKYLNKLLFYKKYGKTKKNNMQSNYRNDWFTKKAY
jgi:hypothetical protein